MTREFNNQRRDDTRSSSRNGNQPPFQRHGAEQFPRPARPRLSRETVDRAWENGAQTQHADYRSRSNGQASPSSNGRHNTQKSEYSSSQNSTGGNHYGHRKNYHDDTSDQPRGNYRRNESQRGPYSRPSGTDRRNESPQGPYSRPSGTDRRNESQQGPYSRSSGADRYNQSQQGPYSRSSGADRYNQSQQGPRSSGPRNFGGPRSQGRPVHNQHDRRFTQRNESNDQQRPRERAQHHPSQPSGEHDKRGNEYHRGRPPYAEQFEGDYERFAYDEPVEVVNDESNSVHKPQRNRRPYQRKSYPEGHEKHVTRLPDGRVLKGSRPEQRKKAQFWGEIAQNTDELVEQVQPAPATSEQPVEEKSNTQAAVEQQDAAKKPHASRPATATRTRSTAKSKKADTTAKKPRSRGPKPSQRGFKWPTA